jgi:hypothetical protein
MTLQVTFALPNGIVVKAVGQERDIRRLTAPYTLTDETLLPPQQEASLRATFTLPSGTWVAIEGQRADIRTLLDHYSLYPWLLTPSQGPRRTKKRNGQPKKDDTMDDDATPKPIPIPERKPLGAPPPEADDDFEGPAAPKFAGEEIDPQWVAEKAAACPEADVLFPKVFNTTNQMDRVLAVLYVLHTYVGETTTLTAREISEVLDELNTPMQPTNISKVFRTEARSFVVKDSTGRAARFRLNAQGLRTVERILAHNTLL